MRPGSRQKSLSIWRRRLRRGMPITQPPTVSSLCGSAMPRVQDGAWRPDLMLFSRQGSERLGLEGHEGAVWLLVDLARPGRIDKQGPADRDEIEFLALQPLKQIVDASRLGGLAHEGCKKFA